jgi:membrane fusion protein (multidrug efflux system)
LPRVRFNDYQEQRTLKLYKMKNILYLIGISILMASCGGASTETPSDAAGLRALIKTKKAEIMSLEDEIEVLQSSLEELEPTRESQVLVSVDTVTRGEFNRYTTLQASVISDDYANVSSETGGRLTSIRVREGQNVSKGQLIATVDLESLEKQRAEVESSLALAKTVYERQERLWNQEIGSEIQYLQAKNNVERLENTIATIESNLKKRNLYAPISGIVDREFLKAGEMAPPGAPIISILNTNNLKVVADVPETYLAKISKGDLVSVSFPALGMETEESIKLIGRTIDPANRTFKIEVNVANMKGLLKPNLLAEVEINDLSVKEVITIPVDIIQEEINGKKYVFVADKKGDEFRASKIYIQTAESYDGQIIVSKGLEGNELIVVDGARSLTDNVLLKMS